jgi:tetratricopeptide (TPR) repeat protein
MKEEREVLVKRTFPQLRKICEERGVTWGEVDLRWGVTEEQKAEGKVLPICLEEIKRCRPYFIGLLGERYGWIPDTIPHDLIDREPWLKEHLSHSVTELEILHGVLNNPEMAEHAFFYFRDPEYIRRLPEGAKRADFLSEDEDAREKLEKLKGRIRKSGFPVHENFPDPKTLGELVLQDLTKFIDVLYPPDQKIDPLDRDALDHEAYAQSRSQVYIGREAYFDRLNKHTQSTDPPLVILGESGSGKSALLANWALKYREEHPHELLVLHFIGASPYSADWAAMLRRIMGELKRHFNIPQEIPDKSDELRSAFANYLHMVSAACLRPSSPLAGEDRGEGVERFSKVILILDALNQLEDHEGALDLVWLPPFIPENIRIFLSTLPGRPLDDLTKRGWPTLTVELLAADERKALIPIYLKQYTKELSAHRIEKIAQAEQTYNPLFLKVLLEELRLFGEHERLDERINHYLEAKDPYELYGKVLARWEEDYGKDLVKDSMPLIWASRRGLTESELLDLLGKDGEPLPRAAWSPLFLAARESLISRSGFLTFAHNFLRDAVRGTYMPIGEDQQSVHLRLADYFEKQELTPRKVDELPWQFRQPNSSRSRQRLYDLLSDLSFFSAAWQKDQFDVKAYWSYLESNSLKMSDAYKPVLTSPENIPDKNHVWQIATLLDDTGNPHEAFSLRTFLVEHYRQNKDIDSLQRSLGNQALILKAWGRLDEAMKLLKEQEWICRELGNIDGIQASLGNQANILYAWGRLDEAMKLHKEEEGICRELGNKDGLSASLCNQGVILQGLGRLEEAMRLHKEEEQICRERGNRDGIQISLGNQATILKAWGRLEEAMKLHKETEQICRELGNKNGMHISLGTQAGILYAWGRLEEAMKLLKETEQICRELGNKDGLSGSLGNQALILKAWGRLEEAMKLFKEQERICKELGNKDSIRKSLGNQATILADWGRLEEAMKRLKEEEQICRELGNPQGLAASLAIQAKYLAFKIGKPKDALPLVEEAYNLSIKCGLSALSQGIKPILDGVMTMLKSPKGR